MLKLNVDSNSFGSEGDIVDDFIQASARNCRSQSKTLILCDLCDSAARLLTLLLSGHASKRSTLLNEPKQNRLQTCVLRDKSLDLRHICCHDLKTLRQDFYMFKSGRALSIAP